MRSTFRHWRIRIFPALALWVLAKHIVFARSGVKGAGYRVFAVGLLGLLVSWWLMDRADQRHLADQEEKGAQDPKHLFDISTGLRANHRERIGIILSLALMGFGLLFQAFALGHFGMIFWGASCCLIAACLWVLT